MEEGEPPIEEEDEPTSEVVDGLELIFGRGQSGYKDVYPHRKGWQAKVTVEDKGVCSLGIFKDKKKAAKAVAKAKAAGLYLLPSPDKTRAKPGCGGAVHAPHLLIPLTPSDSCLLCDCVAAVMRKISSTPLVIPAYSMASLENFSQQPPPVVPVRLLAPADRMKACMEGVSAALAQPVVAQGLTHPTQQQQLTLLPDRGRP